MFGRQMKLFKLLGFEVKIDASWIVIALLVTWSLAKGAFPAWYPNLPPMTYWTMGVVGALGLFASIVAHEFCHSIVARRFGMPMKGITLFIFGGVAEMGDEPHHGPTPSCSTQHRIAASMSRTTKPHCLTGPKSRECMETFLLSVVIRSTSSFPTICRSSGPRRGELPIERSWERMHHLRALIAMRPAEREQ